MARGINKVILVGNLGADPEVRYMPNGGAVASLSLATSESWTDKNSGQRQERTEWHRVTLFNRLGEIAAEYCRKGSQVYIEGSIRTEKYQDKNTGEDRYSTKVIARELQLLGGRMDGQGQSLGGGYQQQQGQGGGNDNYAPQQQQAAPRPVVAQGAPQNAPQGVPQTAAAGNEPFDDDIPF